jgi:hypothetical protein
MHIRVFQDERGISRQRQVVPVGTHIIPLLFESLLSYHGPQEPFAVPASVLSSSCMASKWLGHVLIFVVTYEGQARIIHYISLPLDGIHSRLPIIHPIELSWYIAQDEKVGL